MTEGAIHRAILARLRLVLPRDALVFHVPNGGHMTIGLGARAKSLGALAGVADLLIVWQGRAFFLEIKSATGRQSASQRAFQRAAEEAGAGYEIARSQEDAVAWCHGWNIPLRETVHG